MNVYKKKHDIFQKTPCFFVYFTFARLLSCTCLQSGLCLCRSIANVCLVRHMRLAATGARPFQSGIRKFMTSGSMLIR